ncbi:MAG: phospholipase D-like domain-containing protein [Candidatus Marsarchaeota archaeon]|nr:phospholipase D-like domain-containing protein [Candidatus Marsarchaeota archaeon]
MKERTSSYYGKRAYKYVDKLLREEKNLLIISPYLDDYYAAYLARLAHGKRLYIISSSIRGSAAKRLRRREAGSPAVATFIAVSVNWLLLLLNSFNPLLAFATISAGFALLAYSLLHRNSIYLKVPKEFVHAKLYVGDKRAVEGSANLTYAGMHKNVESVRLITDKREVEELKRRFWTLWNSL